MARPALGINIGHDASCAVVADGEPLAAMQLERVSRRKHDGCDGIVEALPVREVLKAAGVKFGDLGCLVTCHQAAAPGGVGLSFPLISPDCEWYQQLDCKHFSVSHHLAHAACTYHSSGFDDAAVLVCDQAGSTTRDGGDYDLPFEEWVRSLRTGGATALRSECVSVYAGRGDRLCLMHREYGKPHSRTSVHVDSPAALYDNVSRFVFGKENCHGQLMALAGLAGEPQQKFSHSTGPNLVVSDILEVSGGFPRWLNGWQEGVSAVPQPTHHGPLARTVQEALETAMTAYSQQCRKLVKSDNLAVAGGVFLNLATNSSLACGGLYRGYHVPSAPHDVGVALGCAYIGSLKNGARRTARRPLVSDRLGPVYDSCDVKEAILRHDKLVHVTGYDCRRIARLLHSGKIVARYVGRSEFGPRALGGRSILGSPLELSTRTRLNDIKGRQWWRPVAPIVPHDQLQEFFSGPLCSDFMSYMHHVREHCRGEMPAIVHGDGSARCQSLREQVDQGLYALLQAFGRISGFPVLANTSYNTAGQPIVETPSQAVETFISSKGIDLLVLEDSVVQRSPLVELGARAEEMSLAPGCIVTTCPSPNGDKTVLVRGRTAMDVSPHLAEYLLRLRRPVSLDDATSWLEDADDAGSLAVELTKLIYSGLVSVDGQHFSMRN